MIAGQDDDVFGRVALDDVDVLVDRVGRARVPGLVGDALAGRQDVEALVALQPEEIPAALQVADQAVRLVLGRDADAPDAGIERVGQGEVDDAGLAAEVDRRLGAPVGQLQQAAAFAAGEHIGHRRTGKRGACGQERHDGALGPVHRGMPGPWAELPRFSPQTRIPRATCPQMSKLHTNSAIGAGADGQARPSASAGVVDRHVPDLLRVFADGAVGGEPGHVRDVAGCSSRVQSDGDCQSSSIRRWVAQ